MSKKNTEDAKLRWCTRFLVEEIQKSSCSDGWRTQSFYTARKCSLMDGTV